jgi:hypothetical protein
VGRSETRFSRRAGKASQVPNSKGVSVQNRVKTQLCTAELGRGKLEFDALIDEAKQHFIGKKYKVESDSSVGNDGRTDSDDKEDGPGNDIELVDLESNVVQTPDQGQRNKNFRSFYMLPRCS